MPRCGGIGLRQYLFNVKHYFKINNKKYIEVVYAYYKNTYILLYFKYLDT